MVDLEVNQNYSVYAWFQASRDIIVILQWV